MAAGTVDFLFDKAPEAVLRVHQEYSTNSDCSTIMEVYLFIG